MPPRIQLSWHRCQRIARLFSCPSEKAKRSTLTRALGTASTVGPKTIFSGIQPTGVPHLGNYLGALRQWVSLQNEADVSTRLIYSLVDLHAITVSQEPNELRRWRKESLAMLLAIGIDPTRSIVFHQSDVSAHAELMWILSCQASMGYLGRMTQWKDKTAHEKENSKKLKLGLFSYPVLQAADILLYRATHVPVGHDQAQHLEFARELAHGFNHAYGHVLIAPETLLSPAKRVMSLTDPTAKMSKSHANPKSRILLTDSENIIRSKLKTAVTDSFDGISYEPERRPGVSNLIDIIYHSENPGTGTGADGGGTQSDLVKEMDGSSLRAVKERAADAVNRMVRPIRERYAELMGNEHYLEQVASEGASKATQNAAETLTRVKRAIGLSQ